MNRKGYNPYREISWIDVIMLGGLIFSFSAAFFAAVFKTDDAIFLVSSVFLTIVFCVLYLLARVVAQRNELYQILSWERQSRALVHTNVGGCVVEIIKPPHGIIELFEKESVEYKLLGYDFLPPGLYTGMFKKRGDPFAQKSSQLVSPGECYSLRLEKGALVWEKFNLQD